MNYKQLKTNNTQTIHRSTSKTIPYFNKKINIINPGCIKGYIYIYIYMVVRNYDATDTKILTSGNNYVDAKSFKEGCNQSADLQM